MSISLNIPEHRLVSIHHKYNVDEASNKAEERSTFDGLLSHLWASKRFALSLRHFCVLHLIFSRIVFFILSDFCTLIKSRNARADGLAPPLSRYEWSFYHDFSALCDLSFSIDLCESRASGALQWEVMNVIHFEEKVASSSRSSALTFSKLEHSIWVALFYCRCFCRRNLEKRWGKKWEVNLRDFDNFSCSPPTIYRIEIKVQQ